MGGDESGERQEADLNFKDLKKRREMQVKVRGGERESSGRQE